MATAHIKTINRNNNKATVVFHILTPIRNNQVSKAFVDCVLTTNPTTALAVGTLPGQITQPEKDSIEAGLTLEFVKTDVQIQSFETMETDVQETYNQEIVPMVAALEDEYKYLGQNYAW
jgi:hypothetical protein